MRLQKANWSNKSSWSDPNGPEEVQQKSFEHSLFQPVSDRNQKWKQRNTLYRGTKMHSTLCGLNIALQSPRRWSLHQQRPLLRLLNCSAQIFANLVKQKISLFVRVDHRGYFRFAVSGRRRTDLLRYLGEKQQISLFGEVDWGIFLVGLIRQDGLAKSLIINANPLDSGWHNMACQRHLSFKILQNNDPCPP